MSGLSYFKDLQLVDGEVDGFTTNESRTLRNLSRINIFIGQNNSGKSRFLRALFCIDEYRYTTNLCDASKVINILESEKTTFGKFFKGYDPIGSITSSALESVINKFDKKYLTKEGILKTLNIFLELLVNASGRIVPIHRQIPDLSSAETSKKHAEVQAFGKALKRKFEELDFGESIIDSKHYYIPILRGLRPLGNDPETNIYSQRTIKDYFSNIKFNDKVVFTGLELYDTLKKYLLGEPEQRKAVAEYEAFLSDHFFNAEQVTLIPREGDDTIHVMIGKDNQRPIYTLGDGIQNLIILTFNMFLEKNTCLFFIEEPELSMHPGLQRALLNAMLINKQHQYFLTTHSNHFLDMTLDFSEISIFLFQRKKENNSIVFENRLVSEKDRVLLSELGVRNASVFLTQTTIWVEGITDRLYLKEYLKKYISKHDEYQHLKEDIHYSFVEYQGANLIHWNFESDSDDLKKISAVRMCGEAIVIADGDIISKKDRVKVLKGELGNRLILLHCKEIENLIPEVVLRKIVEDKFNSFNVSIDLIKNSDYSKRNIGLGEYLDKLTKKRCFAEKSGTVKSKNKFCQNALLVMNSETDWSLTPELNKICKTILEYISH